MRSIKWLGALLSLGLATPAWGHVVVNSPPARDLGKAGADAHKNGPCGGVARGTKVTSFMPGQAVNVELTETIDHRGCFQVLFSAANDQGFQILQQINDPSGDVVPKKRTMMVNLPATTCSACTLAVRQLMIGQACNANQQSISAGDTYFSCSDICIGPSCFDAGAPDAAPPPVVTDAGGDAGAPPPPAGGDDGGAVATDGGDGGTPARGKPLTLLPPDDAGGCSTAPPGGPAAGALGALVVGALVLARRRARR